MAGLVGLSYYFRGKCHSCSKKWEIKKDRPYLACPFCRSLTITEARAERMEGIDFDTKDKRAQRDANEQIRKMLEKLPTEPEHEL